MASESEVPAAINSESGSTTTEKSTSMEVTFDLQAFCKVILHATKYPQNPVSGILLRRKKSESGNNVVFHEAIPLLHLCKYMTPMMEIALAQVNTNAVF